MSNAQKELISSPSIDPSEIEQFSKIADEWWDDKGKFKPLHQINPVRIEWIRKKIEQHFNIEDESLKTLSSISMIDIGCGGGLVSEPFARLGAKMTGLDASQRNIKTAMTHAKKSGLDIKYIAGSVEDKAEGQEKYDVVLVLEIIEHVADIDIFIKSCASLVKPGGLLFISTINRTLKSFAFAIIGAEYVLKLLPKKTHQWNKFLKPSEIENITKRNSLELQELSGMVFNPLTSSCSMDKKDVNVNYFMIFEKSVDN